MYNFKFKERYLQVSTQKSLTCADYQKSTLVTPKKRQHAATDESSANHVTDQIDKALEPEPNKSSTCDDIGDMTPPKTAEAEDEHPKIVMNAV